jgi:diaminohydroxyphosphoribosylaminopyrimidine deaminase/5-amino-6-(5-phosphoribosylamino)uracil reductase
MVMPAQNGQVDVLAILQELARRGCNEVHVEAGYRLNGSLLAAGVVDELLIYFAPCVLGDTAHGMFQLPPLMELSARQQFKIEDVQKIGEDLRILARI